MSTTHAAPAPAAFRLSQKQLVPLLILPILLVNAISFLWPTFSLLRMSLNEPVAGGAIRETLTLQTYISVMTDGFYLELVWNSIYLCSIITIATLILSYPIALFIHRADPKWRSILTLMVISPLLVSAVVRTYGWVIILGDQGLVNAFLMSTGLVDRPARLIFNNFGVVVGLIEILMPYMILSLMAGFGRLDPRLEEAAQSLGARKFTTLRRVTIPLTAPGIALGCLLVFVLSISSFVTPKLLGGGRVFLLATEIYDQSIVLLNWPLAASLSMLVLVIFGAALVVYSRIVKVLD